MRKILVSVVVLILQGCAVVGKGPAERNYAWSKYGQHVGEYINMFCDHGSARERNEFYQGMRDKSKAVVEIRCP